MEEKKETRSLNFAKHFFIKLTVGPLGNAKPINLFVCHFNSTARLSIGSTASALPRNSTERSATRYARTFHLTELSSFVAVFLND